MGAGAGDAGRGDRAGTHRLSLRCGPFYANADRFADEVRALVEHAPTSVRWFVVDAGAITDIDYSAAQSLRDLLDDLGRQRFVWSSRVLAPPSIRHGPAPHYSGDRRKADFRELHEALAAVRGSTPETPEAAGAPYPKLN